VVKDWESIFWKPVHPCVAAQVIYDRAGASIADVDSSEFDFDKILDGADWFHTTGITPALSDKAAALTEAALKAAKAKGITTSIDLNYRKKLWSKEKASEVMTVFASMWMYVSAMKKMQKQPSALKLKEPM
jgi:sugar/nucleoside kinase (ribokinase family)